MSDSAPVTQRLGRVVVESFVSLDGVVQAPGHAHEDPEGFAHGGWTQPWFADHRTLTTESVEQAHCLLLGRRTWDTFAAAWPTITDPTDRLAHRLNTLPKHVVTHRPGPLPWAVSTPVTGDLTGAVRRLTHQAGARDVLVLGSGQLVQQLLALELVDECRLLVHPVLLGSGRRLFGVHQQPVPLDLLSCRTTGSGLVRLRYGRSSRTA